MKRSLALPVLAAVLFAGCEQAGPSEPVRPSADAPRADAASVTSSARGSGHFTVNDEFRTFAFTVGRSTDGTTRGQFQIVSRHTDSVLHGEVECASFAGNAAWFSGRVTGSDNPSFPVGTVLGMTVEDNGEGAQASPDRASLASTFTPRDPAAWCGAPLATILSLFGPLRDVENGNVQVRP